MLWIPGCSSVVTGPLLSGVGSQSDVLRSSVYFRAFIILLMGKTMAQNAQWLVPACCGCSECCMAGCRVVVVLWLVSAPSWMGLWPGTSRAGTFPPVCNAGHKARESLH